MSNLAILKNLIASRLAELKEVRVQHATNLEGESNNPTTRARITLMLSQGAVVDLKQFYGHNVTVDLLLSFKDLRSAEDAIALVEGVLLQLARYQPYTTHTVVVSPVSWRFVDQSEGIWVYNIQARVDGLVLGAEYTPKDEGQTGEIEWALKLGIWKAEPPAKTLLRQG